MEVSHCGVNNQPFSGGTLPLPRKDTSLLPKGAPAAVSRPFRKIPN
jgi:hypothetical protein